MPNKNEWEWRRANGDKQQLTTCKIRRKRGTMERLYNEKKWGVPCCFANYKLANKEKKNTKYDYL